MVLRSQMGAALSGLAGGVGASLLQGSDLTILGAALVTGISALFGMLSSASRVTGAASPSLVRMLLMNGGAVWTGAFAAAWTTHASLGQSAMIGLGMGLAGSRALEVLEVGAMALIGRLTGNDPIGRRELEELLGEERKRIQGAISEERTPRRAKKPKVGEASDEHRKGSEEA